MEVTEFFERLFGASDPEEILPESELEKPEASAEVSVEETKPKEEKSTGSSDEMRNLVREELKSMISEMMEEKAKATKAARAATAMPVPEENKRTVDDIMAERYLSAMGAKKEKGE